MTQTLVERFKITFKGKIGRREHDWLGTIWGFISIVKTARSSKAVRLSSTKGLDSNFDLIPPAYEWTERSLAEVELEIAKAYDWIVHEKSRTM